MVSDMPKQLTVWMLGQQIGTLAQVDGRLGFTYVPEWLTNPDAVPLSQSLPLQSEPFDDRASRTFFAGLLLEGGKPKGVSASWSPRPCTSLARTTLACWMALVVNAPVPSLC